MTLSVLCFTFLNKITVLCSIAWSWWGHIHIITCREWICPPRTRSLVEASPAARWPRCGGSRGTPRGWVYKIFSVAKGRGSGRERKRPVAIDDVSDHFQCEERHFAAVRDPRDGGGLHLLHRGVCKRHGDEQEQEQGGEVGYLPFSAMRMSSISV